MTIEKYENYLNVLGLECGASLKDIKSAYKKLVLKFHPDRQTDPIAKDLANEKLKKINEARDFLLDNFKYYGNFKTSKSNSSKQEKTSSVNKDNVPFEEKEDNNHVADEDEYDVDIYSRNSNLFNDKWKQNSPESKLNEDLIKVLVFAIFFAFLYFLVYPPTKNANEPTNNSQPQQTETVPQKEAKYVEKEQEAKEEPEKVEVKTVQQKPLTEKERITKFEKEMARAFDNYINNYGQYYDYPQLKDRTFTVEISSYLNNTLYRCNYINGDFAHEYEGSNLYRDFESFMLGLPIYFRNDAQTNNEMRYKMQVTHTPQGTTVKLLDVWHYLEGDYR